MVCCIRFCLYLCTIQYLVNSNGTFQMLQTTHDINLLNEDFIRRDTIWFTDKDELGETKIVRLSSGTV